jgi:cytochrome c551/c552
VTTEVKQGVLLLKVVGFSLFLTLVFTLVANTLPQVEGEAPVDKELDISALTMDSFVTLGEELFVGKGTCTLCHKPPPLGRAPDVQAENMLEVSIERLADDRYQGEAQDAEAYMRESMVDPSKYVVTGWGQKGSNDTVSPMPTADKPPIELTSIEMDAIIAYLQSKDGNEITVSLPEEGAMDTPEKGDALAEAPAPAQTAEEALNKYTCTACHAILDSESLVGPRLDDVSSRLDQAAIWGSIVNPDASISEGFTAGIMPKDFADKMTVKELQMVVEFLAEQKS